jgi:hypothetical protein
LFHAGCRLLTLDPVAVMPPARRIVQSRRHLVHAGFTCALTGFPRGTLGRQGH